MRANHQDDNQERLHHNFDTERDNTILITSKLTEGGPWLQGDRIVHVQLFVPYLAIYSNEIYQ